ncbi:MAG: type II CAAX prenyl endopeptidase Rce1 family protein [Alphaproteobacteria bacterium]
MASSLKTEFFLIFFLTPIFLSFLISSQLVFLFLYVIFLISIYILKKDKNFKFANLKKNIDWKFSFYLSLLFLVSGFIYTLAFEPNLLFDLPKKNFKLWLIVIFLYPFLSVIPQEFIYRVFFYHRYRFVFNNSKKTMMISNMVVFSFGHIVFHNPHAIFITALVSPIFSYAYNEKSFMTCVFIHSIGGLIIFTLGLGQFFF